MTCVSHQKKRNSELKNWNSWGKALLIQAAIYISSGSMKPWSAMLGTKFMICGTWSVMILPIFITALKSSLGFYFDCVFSYFAANFGGCYGCAIGMSITSVVEMVYWIFIKQFVPNPKQECESCKEKGKHHYNSPTIKKIVSLTQFISIAIVLIFACYRFYLVFCKAYNPPQAEEIRNQVTKTKSYFFGFLY